MGFVPHAPLPCKPARIRVATLTCAATRAATTPAVTRRAFLVAAVAAAGGGLLLADGARAAAGGDEVVVKVVKAGKGPTAAVGDLVGIRFKGSYNGVVFDNLFESTQPYFYRVGSDSVLKASHVPSYMLEGIDETIVQMSVGQVVDLEIPPSKAFGSKGRRASPGKPVIPGNATILYTVELSTIPGKEEELLERLGDSDIGSSLL